MSIYRKTTHMKILFLNIVPPRRFIPWGFSHGIGLMSAVLKTSGHTTKLLYLESLNKKALRSCLSTEIDLIAMSSTTDQIDLTKEIVAFLSAITDIPIILGGVHATVSPEDAIDTKGLFGICIGEGEEALLEFVNALEEKKDFRSVKNFWFRTNGTIIKNSVRSLIKNLDEVPFPDRSIFNYQELLDKNYDDGAEFISGRGCYYHCTFCINKTLQTLYKGKGHYVRYRSIDNVIKEIKTVISNYSNIKTITFHDDVFGLKISWLSEFAEKYKRDIQLPFRCNMRADNVNDKHLELLKKAGCIEVWVGVECGNENLRNSLLKKRISTEQILKAFKLLKEYGIKSKAFNMIGLPGETVENIEETIQLNKVIKPEITNSSIFRPYPGTELYDYCKDKNWLSNRRVSGYFEESVLDQPTLSKEDTYFYQMLFYYENKIPRLASIIRWLNKIRIGPKITLFRLIHNKFVIYKIFKLIKKLYVTYKRQFPNKN